MNRNVTKAGVELCFMSKETIKKSIIHNPYCNGTNETKADDML